MSQRFSEGQQLDRQALEVQLAGVQSAYAAQTRAYADEMRGAVAVELQNLRAMEQHVQHQMGVNEQRCAHEVDAVRNMARQEAGEAASHNSENVREVTRLKWQEQEAAQLILIRQQQLLAFENDQSKMARQTSDTESAGRDAIIAELEKERKALAGHEMFWYLQAEVRKAMAASEMTAAENE